MRRKRRIKSGLLCVILCCFLASGSVFAEGGPEGQGPAEVKNTENGGSNGGTGEDGTGENDTEENDNDILDEIKEDLEDKPAALADNTIDFLDLTDASHQFGSSDVIEQPGYIWEDRAGEGYVLTLKNIHITGKPISGYSSNCALELPSDKKVTIKTEGTVILDGGIFIQGGALVLVFDAAVLEINGEITGNADTDEVIVQGGSSISVTKIGIGGSDSAGSTISVTGSGSTLTLTDETKVEHLKVTGGGTLITNAAVRIRSVYDVSKPDNGLGSLDMDQSSQIKINAAPTLVSWEAMDNESDDAAAALSGVLDKIKQYLPVGYQIGWKELNGEKLCTILDKDGNIATTLTLQYPPLGTPAVNPDPPAVTPPTYNKPTVTPPADNRSDADDPEKPGDDPDNDPKPQDPGNDNDSSSKEDPALANGSASHNGAMIKSPQTGENGESEEQNFSAFGYFAVLCLLAGLHKTCKN